MKKRILFFAVQFLCLSLVHAQAPQGFNYQGVARNSFGTVLTNKQIGIRFTLHNNAAAGSVLYSETQSVTTDQYGVFSLQVGGGTATTGTFSSVNWASGTKFLQVEMDPKGGSAYIDMGTTQLMSVPFAMYAASAAPGGVAGGDLNGFYPNPGINPLAVTTGKLADAAVTSSKLSDASVTAQKIVFPLQRSQSDATNAIIDISNTSSTGINGALKASSASTDANAYALTGIMSSGTQGAFSAGVRGINNGTGLAGTGVYGSHAGGGNGVLGISVSGSGVVASSTSGFGLSAVSTSGPAIAGNSGSGVGITATSGTNTAASFYISNTSSSANVLNVTTNGSGYAANISSTNITPLALKTQGALQLTGIGEGAGKVLTSDASGNASWQSPAAGSGGTVDMKAGFNTGITVPSATFVTIPWNYVAFEDGGSNMNTSTGVYTVPVTGTYFVSAKLYWVSFANGTSPFATAITVNGSLKEIAWATTSMASGANFGQVSGLMKLTQGDQIRIIASQTTGTSATIGNAAIDSNNFNVFLVK